MFASSVRRWLRKMQAQSRPASPRTNKAHPEVEMLEGREVPTVIATLTGPTGTILDNFPNTTAFNYSLGLGVPPSFPLTKWDPPVPNDAAPLPPIPVETDPNVKATAVELLFNGVALENRTPGVGVFNLSTYRGVGVYTAYVRGKDFYYIFDTFPTIKDTIRTSVTLSRSVTVVDDDSTPPTINLTGSSDIEGDDLDQEITWEIEDLDSGISNVTVNITKDGTQIVSAGGQPDTGAYNFDALGPGIYDITVLAYDGDADWVGDAALAVMNRTIIVTDSDTTPPVIAFTGSSGAESDGATQSFSWNATDASGVSANVVVKRNGTTISTSSLASGSYNFDAEGLGTYQITVQATDNDNSATGDSLSATSTRTVVVADDDTTAPTLSLTGSTGTELDTSTQQFSWTSADTSGVTTSLVVTKAGSTVFTSAAATGSFNFDALGVGTFQADLSVTNNDNDWVGDAQAGSATRSVVVQPSVVPPVPISINSVRKAEGNTGTKPLDFAVTLGSASAGTVTVAYATAENTAKSPSDYVSQTGTVTFLPGETSKTVSIALTGDTLRELNEQFFVNLSSPTNGTLSVSQGVGTLVNDEHEVGTYRNGTFFQSAGDVQFSFDVEGTVPFSGDWNGDGIAEIGAWRQGVFYLDSNSSREIDFFDRTLVFGLSTDTPIVGDWDGDGIDQVGVWRAGRFYLDLNNDALFNGSDVTFGFGSVTDLPIVGDWNSDGRDDIGVRRPTNGYVYLDANGSRSFGAGDSQLPYGSLTDLPIVGDWDGNGRDDIGVWRNGSLYLDSNGTGLYEITDRFLSGFSSAGALPVTGDWNGDGITDLGSYQNEIFKLDLDANYSINLVTANYGTSADTSLVGDWNGDGRDEVGVWRNGVFTLDANRNFVQDGADLRIGFGSVTDVPVIGDWNGDGSDDVGVFRNGLFYLDSNGSRAFDGADAVFSFGSSSDTPLVGDWNGDGRDEVGVWRSSNAGFYLDSDGSRSFNPSTDAVFSYGSQTDTPVVGDGNGDGIDDVGVWRAGLFLRDLNGSQLYEPLTDLPLAFGATTDKPLVGRW